MDEVNEFNFGSNSVANAYNNVLVPVLFEPWADSLIQKNKPWSGNQVLDLACGTGVVTKKLAQNITKKGKIIALDMNREMLNIAKSKCTEWTDRIEFVEGSADSLPVSKNSMDKVVCQQGFQFFPNKTETAREIHRVLKPGGKAIISTWCSVEKCEIFGAICEALEAMDKNGTSQTMRIPFSFTEDELRKPFDKGRFSHFQISKQEQKLYVKGGEEMAIKMAYATPIGPDLNALSPQLQDEFKKKFIDKLKLLKQGDSSFGRMVTNVLYIEK